MKLEALQGSLVVPKLLPAVVTTVILQVEGTSSDAVEETIILEYFSAS